MSIYVYIYNIYIYFPPLSLSWSFPSHENPKSSLRYLASAPSAQNVPHLTHRLLGCLKTLHRRQKGNAIPAIQSTSWTFILDFRLPTCPMVEIRFFHDSSSDFLPPPESPHPKVRWTQRRSAASSTERLFQHFFGGMHLSLWTCLGCVLLLWLCNMNSTNNLNSPSIIL